MEGAMHAGANTDIYIVRVYIYIFLNGLIHILD